MHINRSLKQTSAAILRIATKYKQLMNSITKPKRSRHKNSNKFRKKMSTSTETKQTAHARLMHAFFFFLENKNPLYNLAKSQIEREPLKIRTKTRYLNVSGIRRRPTARKHSWLEQPKQKADGSETVPINAGRRRKDVAARISNAG